MAHDTYELGVSEFTTWPWTFEQDVEAYRRHGVAAIEITEAKLDPVRIPQQIALITGGSSLKVCSVQAKVHSLYPTLLQPEPRDPRDRLRHIRESIAAIAPHVPGASFVVITGAPPSGDVHEVLRTARRDFPELARFAEAHGVRIALEPLNPALMNVDSSLWSLGDGLDLIDDVGHAAFGLCLDTWNVWQSPLLYEDVARAGERIFLVQVSDWRVPRGHYDRLVPGEGGIPLISMVDAIRTAGYVGPYVVEIFSSESLPESLWRADLDAVLERCVLGFEKIWGAVVEGGPFPKGGRVAVS